MRGVLQEPRRVGGRGGGGDQAESATSTLARDTIPTVDSQRVEVLPVQSFSHVHHPMSRPMSLSEQNEELMIAAQGCSPSHHVLHIDKELKSRIHTTTLQRYIITHEEGTLSISKIEMMRRYGCIPARHVSGGNTESPKLHTVLHSA
eukprot:5551075-Pyramimonas_sp.AAC.2